MCVCVDVKLNRMYYIILKYILLVNKIQIKKNIKLNIYILYIYIYMYIHSNPTSFDTPIALINKTLTARTKFVWN